MFSKWFVPNGLSVIAYHWWRCWIRSINWKTDLRAIYMRKTKRMTWTMRLININSMFALSYLIILTPIGKRKILIQLKSVLEKEPKMRTNRSIADNSAYRINNHIHILMNLRSVDVPWYWRTFIRCLSDIRTLISTNWKQSRLTCKYSMFWLYVCSGVSIISNAVLTLGFKRLYFKLFFEGSSLKRIVLEGVELHGRMKRKWMVMFETGRKWTVCECGRSERV